MKRKIITTTLTSTLALAAMTGNGFAALFWNGVDTTAGWDTTAASAGWGSTDDLAVDVGDDWVNGNDAVIGGAGGLSSILVPIVVNNLTSTGTGASMNFNGGNLTVNGNIDAGTNGFRFSNNVDGTYTLTNGLATLAGGNMSGSVTVNSGGILMSTVGSTLSGNVNLAAGTLRTRWATGQNQSMGVYREPASFRIMLGAGTPALIRHGRSGSFPSGRMARLG